jgi:hypothetical protein
MTERERLLQDEQRNRLAARERLRELRKQLHDVTQTETARRKQSGLERERQASTGPEKRARSHKAERAQKGMRSGADNGNLGPRSYEPSTNGVATGAARTPHPPASDELILARLSGGNGDGRQVMLYRHSPTYYLPHPLGRLQRVLGLHERADLYVLKKVSTEQPRWSNRPIRQALYVYSGTTKLR